MSVAKWIQLYKDKSLGGDSGTETFPLKRTDQILEMILKIRAKNGATQNTVDAAAQETVQKAISKIQIASGSSIFKSYSGEMCRKLAAYRNGKMPAALVSQKEGGTWGGNDDPLLGWQEYVFPINFNLKHDPYANKTGVIMPAPLYDSLDLVLDYSFTISATAGFVTGGTNHVFDLYALVLPRESRENMANKRILTETKKHDYTTVAAGDEPFKLTLDQNRMLRQLIVQCYEAGIGEGIDITDLVLKANNEVMWASKWGDLQAKNAIDCDWDEHVGSVYLESIGTTDEHWTRIPAVYAHNEPVTEEAYTIMAYVGDKITLAASAAAKFGHLDLYSKVLPAMVVIDLDQDQSLLNLQPQGINDLELLITQGAAGGTVQILEQSICRPWGYS